MYIFFSLYCLFKCGEVLDLDDLDELGDLDVGVGLSGDIDGLHNDEDDNDELGDDDILDLLC